MIDVRAGEPLRILSLDDDLGNQSLIRAILTRTPDPLLRHAVVLTATTLAEAREILERDPVDLLLLDVHLPDGLGLDLAAELRSDEAADERRPAVLALTASVLPADQQAALDAGCDAFLAKPFPASGLVSTIRRLVDERARAATAAHA